MRPLARRGDVPTGKRRKCAHWQDAEMRPLARGNASTGKTQKCVHWQEAEMRPLARGNAPTGKRRKCAHWQEAEMRALARGGNAPTGPLAPTGKWRRCAHWQGAEMLQPPQPPLASGRGLAGTDPPVPGSAGAPRPDHRARHAGQAAGASASVKRTAQEEWVRGGRRVRVRGVGRLGHCGPDSEGPTARAPHAGSKLFQPPPTPPTPPPRPPDAATADMVVGGAQPRPRGRASPRSRS